MAVEWPDGKSFAFTIFDDPDSQSLEQSHVVYSFLSDLNFRTTIGVWPLSPSGEANSPGETCDNREYVVWLKDLERRGFEIGLHNVAPATMTREQIRTGLDRFAQDFGDAPITMANHYNGDAMYWGAKRFSGLQRILYNAITLGRARNRFFGEMKGHPSFWGDICAERVAYCRNLTSPRLNTLAECPTLPYHDADRPFVQGWFSAADASQCDRFIENVTIDALTGLEQVGGACILFTHFGLGYCHDGQLNNQFRSTMQWLSKRNGWFVPVSTLLNFLNGSQKTRTISRRERNVMERHWLVDKLLGRLT